jgi:ABC-2 type transport system ATP-binding protein
MIEVDQLHKHFRLARHHRGFWGSFRNLIETDSQLVRAVDGVSFAIAEGEFVGFIGPNGAGKSTTIKMLAGVLEPSAGRLRVAGLSPSRDRIAYTARIGVVFGQRTQLWWDLPVIESYHLLQRIYGVPARAHKSELERLSALLELGPLLDVPVRKLSLGQRMRCELAAALLHAPRLLFLDEPTIGLDVVAKETIREFLAEQNRTQKTTILLTTHDLSDVERLCQRTILIDHGRLAYDGSLADLRRRFANERRLRAIFDGPAPSRLPAGVVEEERAPSRLVLRFDPGEVAVAQLIAELSRECALLDLAVEEPPIEQLIAELYRKGVPPSAQDR